MQKNAAALRPRLRGDVYVVAVPDGAYVRNNQSSTLLRGAGGYEWLQRITPYLDGRRSLADLTAGLPDTKRQTVEKLVRALLDNGYARDVTEDEPHTLSPAVVEAYQAEIAFVDYFCDSAERRFERFRDSDIVLVGAGAILQSLVAAQFQTGARRVRVVLTGECPTDRQRLRGHAVEAAERDPEQALEILDAADHDLADVVRGADAVLHVSDRPMAGRARALHRLCAQAGVPLAQAVAVGDEVWLGPVVAPGCDQLSWESAWYRLRSRAETGADRFLFADRPEEEPSEYLCGPTVALAANHLSFACFRYVTGIEPAPDTGTIVRFDLETLETTNHRFLPYPRAVPADAADRDGFADTLARLRKEPALSGEEISQRSAGCVDPRTGLFGAVEERDYEQVPLYVSRVSVADPADFAGSAGAGTEGPGSAGLAVTGYGDTVGEARLDAALRAFARYASRCVDRRRLLTSDATPLHPADPVSQGRIWGCDLVTGEPRLVPATAAFPVLGSRGASMAPDAGVAAGHDWDGAVRAGLDGLCGELAATVAVRAEQPFPAVDLGAEQFAGAGARYRDLLRLVEEPVAVHDLSTATGFPAFAFQRGTETVAYHAGADRGAALTAGLRTLLVAYQARVNDQPAYAPPGVPPLPVRLHGAVAPAQAGQPDRLDDNELVAAIQAHGVVPVAVPLDHDPAASDVLPFLVRVVALDA